MWTRCLSWGLLIVSAVFAQSPRLAAALAKYEQGDFAAAVEACSQLLRKAPGDPTSQIEVMLLRSASNRLLGQNDSAVADLRVALRTARRLNQPELLARVLLAMTSAELASGKTEASHTVAEAQTAVGAIDDPGLKAELSAVRGELLEFQQRFADAADAHRTAAANARAARRPVLAVRSFSSAAKAMNATGDATGASIMLTEAAALARTLPSSHQRDAELIRIGVIAISLLHRTDTRTTVSDLAKEVLGFAAASSEQLGQWVNASHAWGNIAALNERMGESASALEAVGKAKHFARKAHAPDPLYRWEWLSARLTAKAGHIERAIDEYSRAVDNLQTVRSASAGATSLSFRDTEGRLYFDLVDLLLQRAAKEPANSRSLLTRARQTMERFKRAELADYFRDECVEALQARAAEIEEISSSALVVYPVPLPDRLELIFGSAASGLHRIAVPVTEEELTREVRSFRAFLEKRTTNEYRVPGRKLHDWLIAPLLNHSAFAGVDTLVFVPDGALRLIPFSALHNGREFLISKYAVVVTPSLTLSDARPIRPGEMSLLAGGVTTSRAGLASLPGVKTELTAIEGNLHTKVLLDKDFTSNELERQLRRGRHLGLHIASHAVISQDANRSYLLTSDSKLTMEHLAQLIGVTRFREQPLELLFLSGCETAVGDDRAALGLAGVALAAGAKSAVATLWHVNDDSTSQIVARFYELFASNGMTKAKALQEAQKTLLEHTWYSHPGYWSAFLLINNWL